jgi:hypothetical protein
MHRILAKQIAYRQYRPARLGSLRVIPFAPWLEYDRDIVEAHRTRRMGIQEAHLLSEFLRGVPIIVAFQESYLLPSAHWCIPSPDGDTATL